MHGSATDSDCGAATETAAEKYLRNERVGSSVAGEVSATVVYVLDPTRSHDVPESHFGKAVSGVLVVDRYSERTAAESALQQHVATMAAQRDFELAVEKLREPCRRVLESLTEHWGGLTLFVNDPRIPMDNSYGERLIRGPAVGRRNYYGSGAEWSGRLAMMLFSIFATLSLRRINPRR